MKIDGRAFWLRVDSELIASEFTLRDMCKDIGVSYFTVNTQRKNHALPKIEQLLGMANFLHKTVEELVIGKDKNKIDFPPRVMNIAAHCMVASGEDLTLVERILRIEPDDGEKSSASGAFA